MKKEMDDKDKFIESLQRELEGVSFTPNRYVYIFIFIVIVRKSLNI
jgi:hypothetical protein